MYPHHLQKKLKKLAGNYPVVTILRPRQSGKTKLVLCHALLTVSFFCSYELFADCHFTYPQIVFPPVDQPKAPPITPITITPAPAIPTIEQTRAPAIPPVEDIPTITIPVVTIPPVAAIPAIQIDRIVQTPAPPTPKVPLPCPDAAPTQSSGH
jgi:hypothetical protein